MTAPERIWAWAWQTVPMGQWGVNPSPSSVEYIRADLAAVPAQVRVKPLVWEPVGNPNGRYRLHSTVSWARNTCPYGPYFIGLSSSCKDGEYSWDGPENTGKRGFADPEAAKAAAQADYEARILAAIEPQPDPRDLETCGKCMGSGYGGHPDSGHLCDDCNGIGGVPQPDPRIAYYEQAYQYALTLADALMAKHYPDNKNWRPLGDLIGLLTQIDNMVAGKKPDPRDEVIARLVEALEAIADYGTILTSNKNHDELRAAIAAAKAVQHG